MNPNYKPPSKSTTPVPSTVHPPRLPVPSSSQKRDVVIGGVAFESSGRSLVRKDLNKPSSVGDSKPPRRPVPPITLARNKAGTLVNPNRTYKPKVSRGRARNMTLNNSHRPYQGRRVSSKRKVNKPCARFTTTGACNRGLTCMYQHDPTKIAICWNFLQGNCPNTAETCALSHDPTLERTPLCVHFANNGRCHRANCPFPHVRVGKREGVCRDFAVLGYCEKGLDCDKQHVRECPDFAEKGECTTKGCKLPHVIRANRNRKAATSAGSKDASAGQTSPRAAASVSPNSATADASSSHPVTAEEAQLGDEFISLTFHESGSDDDSDEDEDDESDDDEEDANEEVTETHDLE